MKAYHKPWDIPHLKQTINPVDFYAFEGQEIKTQGSSPWKLGGLCPFHADRQAGSFYIHLVSGGYCCFSCQAKGGDILDFTQKKHGLSFKDAVQKLIRDWRVI